VTQANPIRPAGSLIERAAEVYDFRPFLKTTSAPDAAALAPAMREPDTTAPSPAAAVNGFEAASIVQKTVQKIDLALLREGGFIVPGSPPTRLSEEYRIVKRQVLMSAFGGSAQEAVKNGRLVLMCSAQPNEGKTFSAVNLALSLATEPDLEVLLIDADVAKPEVLSTLGIGGDAGLMDALLDPAIDVESLIVPTDVPKLKVLPAGRQTNHDTELLASQRGKAVIQALSDRNPSRIIIIDTAPALAASPASALVHLVGQVLLVVRADETSENELRETVGLMAGAAQLRLLINGVTYRGTNRNYGTYYGYGEVA
jgi:protein-tyrosine kinase